MIIIGIGLLVFGPKRLPEVGRTLGKGMREFKSTMGEIEDVKKSTIGQVDDLKDSFRVDLSGRPKDIYIGVIIFIPVIFYIPAAKFSYTFHKFSFFVNQC